MNGLQIATLPDAQVVDSIWEEIASNFFCALEYKLREAIKLVLERAIREEFDAFIGAGAYKRSAWRKDRRNGKRQRELVTRFGTINNLEIPRAREYNFNPQVLPRYRRREDKVSSIVSDIFLRGVSTRKIKAVTETLFGESMSPSTVSNISKRLRAEMEEWLNRPIEDEYQYLFLDAVALPIKRVKVDKEALLCAYGIRCDGRREFLGFQLGGKESTAAWESFLLRLKRRGLWGEKLKLIIVDGNPGLLNALSFIYPDVEIQRCLVHKLRNIALKCPKSLKDVILAECKRIFNAESYEEALALFKEWKNRYQKLVPAAVECLEKDLDSCLAYYKRPYRLWKKIRTTNIIERCFREFRRRIKVMDSFPNEDSCLRIMYGLVVHLNEGWQYRPISDFQGCS